MYMEKKEFKFEQGIDYYLENGQIIMTESYLVRKKSCCGSGCRHCPFERPHTKGSTELKKHLKGID